MSKLLTTTQATEWLASQRGIEVDASTVRRWCQSGVLDADKHELWDRWMIPVKALADVEPPRPGPKPKRAG